MMPITRGFTLFARADSRLTSHGAGGFVCAGRVGEGFGTSIFCRPEDLLNELVDAANGIHKVNENIDGD